MMLLTACVEPDAPGVGVQKLAADIVFGVKPPSPDVPPPNLAPGTAGPGDAVTYVPPVSFTGPPSDIPAPRAPRTPNARLPRLTPLASPKSPCPPAALTAFPAQEAGLVVEGRPAEGLYRWKRKGTQTVANLPGVKLPIDGFEQRLVRNVVKVSDTEYTFETIQPELAGGITTISTFKVKTDAPSRSATTPVAPPDPNHPTLPVTPPVPPPTRPPGTPELPTPPGTVTVGDPERGISLLKLQRVDAQGNSSELTFSPAVLYLPLPVQPGEQFTAVGIDARTGSVLQHQARVLRRERVDACGDIVDGWAVESTQTFSGSTETSPPRTYRYIIAPQLGGIIVSEEIHVTSPQGQTDAVFTLGQLRPTPPPAEVRK
jgi:hypothetical protein